MNKGHKSLVWWESPLATIQVQIGEFFLIWYWNPLALPYMIIGQPQWSWNTTAGQGECCVIIHIKYLNYSDSLSAYQTQLNNSQHH